MFRMPTWTLMVLMATGALTGCDKGGRADAERRAAETRKQAAEAAARAGEAAQGAVEATREAIAKAGESDTARKAAEVGAAATGVAADLTRSAAAAAAGGALTAAIATALMADRNIDASRIDVDTDEARRIVTLKGRVPTAAQRTAALALARTKATGYEIRDQLVVDAP
jgi:osmotically-inducible protein OsmY